MILQKVFVLLFCNKIFFKIFARFLQFVNKYKFARYTLNFMQKEKLSFLTL